MDSRKKKIAIITPRYGREAAGQVPYAAAALARRLAAFYSVTVLTSTAKDYDSFANYYPEGESVEDGVKLLRFKTTSDRDEQSFERLEALRVNLGFVGKMLDKKLIREKGPLVRGLTAYIKEHTKDYDRMLFLTFSYYTTVAAWKYAADKAVLIPFTKNADEIALIKRDIYRDIFSSAKFVIYKDEEEKQAIEALLKEPYPESSTGVTGFEIPPYADSPEKRAELVSEFRKKYAVEGEYILYTGHISAGRECDKMFECFAAFKESKPGKDMHLTVIGRPDGEVVLPVDIGAYYPGFVSEKERFAAIAGAELLWFTAESPADIHNFTAGLMFGVPAIVSGNCTRLAEMAKRSESAFVYDSKEDCIKYMSDIAMMSDRDYARISVRGRFFSEDNYGWDAVTARICKMIEA